LTRNSGGPGRGGSGGRGKGKSRGGDSPREGARGRDSTPRDGTREGSGRGSGRGSAEKARAEGKPRKRSGAGRGKSTDPEERPASRGRAQDRGSGPAAKRPSPRKRTSRSPNREPAPATLPDELRLQTYLARAGVASRRASEELIREGRVTIDGERAEIGAKVQIPRDQVRVDGAIVQLQKVAWIALNKPTGYVTTRDDPSGRRTVYDLIPSELHHLFHVGRLDRDSSGLLLLTNDGDAANRLLHPRYETDKEYWADVEGEPTEATIRRLVDGLELEDGVAQAVAARSLGPTDAGTHRIEIVLREGKNREVRRMLEAVGHPVLRLLRRRFGPIELGKLRTGHFRHLTAGEVNSLR
jgi:23S rRNA pseudouridine2605 synthase